MNKLLLWCFGALLLFSSCTDTVSRYKANLAFSKDDYCTYWYDSTFQKDGKIWIKPIDHACYGNVTHGADDDKWVYIVAPTYYIDQPSVSEQEAKNVHAKRVAWIWIGSFTYLIMIITILFTFKIKLYYYASK